MDTSGSQGGYVVDDKILFILLVLSYPRPSGRIGNEDGRSGKPKKNAPPHAVLKNKIVGLQDKMTPRFEGFKVEEDGKTTAWQVQLDPNMHTKQKLLDALDAPNYKSILSAIKGDKWNLDVVRTRIKAEKNIKNGDNTLLMNVPNLLLGDLILSSKESSGTSGLLPALPFEPVQFVQSSNITGDCNSTPDFLFGGQDPIQGPDLSLTSPLEQDPYDTGVCKCIAYIYIYISP